MGILLGLLEKIKQLVIIVCTFAIVFLLYAPDDIIPFFIKNKEMVIQYAFLLLSIVYAIELIIVFIGIGRALIEKDILQMIVIIIVHAISIACSFWFAKDNIYLLVASYFVISSIIEFIPDTISMFVESIIGGFSE